RIQQALTRSGFSLYQLIFVSLFCVLRATELNYEDNLSATSSLASNLRKAYTNEWAVRIAGGSEEEATRLAAKYGYLNLGRILWMEQQVAKKRVKRDYRQRTRSRRARPINENDLSFGEDETLVSKSRNRKQPDPNDPLWTDMWYLNRAEITGNSKMDHNVKEAWDLGYTGRGVVVTILDDGLERTHPDIAPNYDARASYDVNDRDDDPMPRYEYSDENRHTLAKCAGESIYTLSISAATENGNIPWYSEACSSTLASTYSSGATGEKMIVTTDLHHACTNTHTGTSASAPLAAGIVALTLEANPDLTWRDLQHIVIRAAKPINLRAGDWVTNGVGRNVSHSFGYGLMDAGAMAIGAELDNSSRTAQMQTVLPESIQDNTSWESTPLHALTYGCAGSPDEQVVYLEHVQAIITLKAPKRGDIQIYLTSPSGRPSTSADQTARDTSRPVIEWPLSAYTHGELLPAWTLNDNETRQAITHHITFFNADWKMGIWYVVTRRPLNTVEAITRP
ncbi:convertase P-domain protein, partial [Ostertagia ostertagi]